MKNVRKVYFVLIALALEKNCGMHNLPGSSSRSHLVELL